MQIDQAAHKTAMARLEPLVGEWSLEASFDGAPPAGVGARAVFEWVLSGTFLLERAEIPQSDAPDGHCIIGYDAERDAYTQHYFDSRGVARVYAMTFSEGVWTLLRETPDFTPLAFSQRFTGTLSDDAKTITGGWESSSDASTWEHDFDLTYTKES
jgi:hypothetical protein